MEHIIKCRDEKNHQWHFCMLTHQGLTRTVSNIPRDADFACAICGAEVDTSVKVCAPVAMDKLKT